MKRVLFWLGYVWALPVTVAGLWVASLFRCELFATTEGAFLYESGPWLEDHFFDRRNVAAFTWGAVIIMHPHYRLDGTVLAHELVHYKQARILGPLLPIAYGLCSLFAWATGKNPYFDNALEVHARKVAGR